MIASLFGSLLLAMAPEAAAAVNNGQAAGLTVWNQNLRDDSTGVPVLAWGSTASAGETINFVDVNFINRNNFNPNQHLEPLNTNGAVSGVAIYRDSSTNGANQDVLDSGDSPLTLSNTWWAGNTAVLDVNAETVPANANGIYEWFIVIRSDWDLPENAYFQVRFDPNDILYSTGATGPSFTVTSNRLRADIGWSTDIAFGSAPGGGKWIGNWSAPINDSAALGFHITDGGAGDNIDYIDVDVWSWSGTITNSDFLALDTNGSLSGFGLYRDDGLVNDEWDANDTYVNLSAISGGFSTSISLDVNAEPVPDSGSGNFDFFFVVRPSATISTWDAVRVGMWAYHIRVDGIVDTDQYAIRNDNFERPLYFDATPPTIQWGWWFEGSPYLYTNTTGTLFFSSLMQGVETGSLAGQATDSGSGTDRMEFSNEPGLYGSPGVDNSPDNWQGDYYFAASSDDDDSPVNITLYDNVGWNVSNSYSYMEDNGLPNINVTYPTAGQHIGGDVAIKATVYDDLIPLQLVQISTDYGASWNNMVWDGSDFTFVWSTGATPDGAGRISVRAYDMVMNSAIGTQNIVVDNSGPVVIPTTPASGDFVAVGNQLSLMATASDASNIDEVNIRVDGGTWSKANFDYLKLQWYTTWTPTTEGFHLIEFQGSDELGNMGGISSSFVYADGTAPLVDIVSPVDGEDLRGWVTIQIDASDDQRLDGVALSLDKQISWYGAAFNPSTGYYEITWDTTNFQDGIYDLVAAASDAAGNSVLDMDTEVTVDNTDPFMSIDAPVYNEFIKGDYEISATVMDSTTGIDTVEYRVDGGDWSPMTVTGDEAAVTWDTTILRDGGHTLELQAFDHAGNMATRSTTVMVDNGLPTGFMVEPKEGQYISGQFIFTVHADDYIGVETLNLNFSGDSSISGLGTVMATYGIADGLWQYSVDTTLYTDGPASITPTMFDRAGNSFTGAPVNFKIDNWPSAVTIVSPEENALVEGSITLDIELTERFIDTVVYRIDGSSWTSLAGPDWSSDIDTESLLDGPHTIKVQATDNSSRVTTEDVTITVDNTPPEVVIVEPLNNQVLEGVQTFRVAASDIVGIKTLDIKIGDRESSAMIFNGQLSQYEYTMDTADLEDGTYTVKATASDEIGHSTSTSIEVDILNNPVVLAPTGVFITPLQGELVSGVIQVQVSAEDNLGVSTVALERDIGGDLPMVMETSSGFYTTFFDTTNLADGPTNIEVTITNIAGKSTTISRNVTVDNSAPDVIVKKKLLEDGSTQVKATVTDSSGVAQVQYRVDGGEWMNMADMNGDYVAYWQSDVGDNGKHIIEVRAVDEKGNEGSDTTTVTVDIFDTATAGMFSIAAVILILAALALVLAFVAWKKRPKDRLGSIDLLDDKPPRRKTSASPDLDPEPKFEEHPSSLNEKLDESEIGPGDMETK